MRQHDDDNRRERLPPRKPRDLFELDTDLATSGAMDLLTALGLDPLAFINRHKNGDWGDIDEQDKKSNEPALNTEGRLFSSYALPDGNSTVWVITERDRSTTTVLLPSEY